MLTRFTSLLELPQQEAKQLLTDEENKVMTTQEMMKAKAKPGYWFVNVANVDQPQDWQEQVKPYEASGLLFGYEEKEFMAKQYK